MFVRASFICNASMPAEAHAMSYIEKDLIPGEQILFKTRLHSIVLVRPLLEALVLCALGGFCIWGARTEQQSNPNLYEPLLIGATIYFIIALVRIVYGFIKRNSTEMAVTNRRVLIKWGLASRRTLEILLAKVESISVDESFWGRMLGYGTIVIRGTGGTPEPIVMVSRPGEFRRMVQQQAELSQGGGSRPAAAAPSA
jgi:uncharacterized membrane protein YdbT with pleckstrin-like domain